MLRKLPAMAARIEQLEQQLQAKDAGAATAAPARAPARLPTAAATKVPPSSSPLSAPQPQLSPAAPAGSTAENKGLFGLAPSPVEGLTFSAYGELKYGAQQNPSANGQWQTGFDAARPVLLPTYQSPTISS